MEKKLRLLIDNQNTLLKQRIAFLTLCFSWIFCVNAIAAIPQNYKIGGQIGHGFTLMNFEFKKISQNERWILSVGDRFGQTNKNNPPYYHIEQKNSKLIYLDIAQTSNSQLTTEQIIRNLKLSKYFKNIDMTIDPIDQTMNLRIHLKQDASLKVYQVRGQQQTSKIVIDFISTEKN